MDIPDKYLQTLARYNTTFDTAALQAEVNDLLSTHLPTYQTPDTLRRLVGFIDLTSLGQRDDESVITRLTQRVNTLDEEHPELPHVASVCVFPNFAEVVATHLDVSEVGITAVAGGFPFSQTFDEVKVAECALAIAAGATEIDVVINLGAFLAGRYEEMCDTLIECKEACHGATFKVILETGELPDLTSVAKASLLAMYADADFIKTSTGKMAHGASPEAVLVMCKMIKAYYETTGRRVGVKVAGGVRTPLDALRYYTIVAATLGDEWLTREGFRIGASSLLDNLLEAIATA